MRHDLLSRLAATGAFALLILCPLSLPGIAGAGSVVKAPAQQCSNLRSVVNGQVIEMPMCRRAD
ncbi:hypothetical protein BurJ1DRAFT_2768 [Burkholderiales bacterium JOSHI_001]|nr:hypothetical protein BurJ1DRAFT_2768 [Burkholderiales bacterium JOSHI_001]